MKSGMSVARRAESSAVDARKPALLDRLRWFELTPHRRRMGSPAQCNTRRMCCVLLLRALEPANDINDRRAPHVHVQLYQCIIFPDGSLCESDT